MARLQIKLNVFAYKVTVNCFKGYAVYYKTMCISKIKERDVAPCKSVRSWCEGLLDRSFMVDPLNYFSFQPILHNWCNKGCGMYYPVCGMVHIKEPLLLIGKISPCGDSGFPLSLFEWSFTICLTPYNRK